MFRLAACFMVAMTTVSLTPTVSVHAEEQVDMLLVLAVDVSRSIDFQKFKLQREGYAQAISDRRVLQAITAGPTGRIALQFDEWSGADAQQVVVDWTMIDSAEAAGAFGDQVLKAPRSFAERTSISGGIDFAVKQIERAPYPAARHTIDVSGDGTNNSGRDVRTARDEAVAKHITINGLVILTENPQSWDMGHTNPPGGLAAYYHDNVVGGPNAFVVSAQDFNAFGQAILKKLIAEIAALRTPLVR